MLERPEALHVIPIRGLPILDYNFPPPALADLVGNMVKNKQFPTLEDGDILAFSHTFLGKIYRKAVDISNLTPNKTAKSIADLSHKDPQQIQLILEQSKALIRVGHVIITENKAGIIGTNAGVDKSNVPGIKGYVVIPEDPNALAGQVQSELEAVFHRKIPIIITDSVGRPFREGSIGIAIGSVDVPVLLNCRQTTDLYGYRLQSKEVAILDQLASLADMIMGQQDEAIPMVIIRGFQLSDSIPKQNLEGNNAARLLRAKDKDLFRHLDWVSVIKYRKSHKIAFSTREVDGKLIQQAIEYAALAPNAHNVQSWRFIQIQKGLKREVLANAMVDAWKEDLQQSGVSESEIQKRTADSIVRFTNAPVLLVICYDKAALQTYPIKHQQLKEEQLAIQSTAAALTTLLFAFEGLGLAACWHSAGLFAADTIQRTLHYPDTWVSQAIIIAGYSEEKEYQNKSRKPLNDIFFDAQHFHRDE
jgi:coenzyme F420-0:L-glutamate ligase/coenzyme F420-1:gamma-L-glutamate ligase